MLKIETVKGNGIFFKALTKGEEWLLIHAQFEAKYDDGDRISPRSLLCKTRLATSHELHNYNYLNSIFKKRAEANSSHCDASPMKRKLSEENFPLKSFLFCFLLLVKKLKFF